MRDRIELIDPDLLCQHSEIFKLVEYWAKATNRPVGWHYWLDIIWIISHLKKTALPPGSKILDAGAGNGLLQFILASMGYEIVSLDYADRDVPRFVSRIFNIKQQNLRFNKTDHPYKNFIKHTHGSGTNARPRVLRFMRNPVKGLINLWFNRINPLLSYSLWFEILLSKLRLSKYGSIVYATDDFTELNTIPDESIDCVVSVSALEHSDHRGISKAVKQFSRVLKKNGSMLVTVSAAKDKDWFFKPCMGWCFCEESLRTIFSVPDADSNFSKYDKLFSALRNCDAIKRRIDRYYFNTGDSGLPWGIYDPKYLPVGIIKTIS